MGAYSVIYPNKRLIIAQRINIRENITSILLTTYIHLFYSMKIDLTKTNSQTTMKKIIPFINLSFLHKHRFVSLRLRQNGYSIAI
jgi:hypothetical protein